MAATVRGVAATTLTGGNDDNCDDALPLNRDSRGPRRYGCSDFSTQTTAGEARQVLTRRRYASRRDLAVSDEGRLVGLVTIENLLPADGGEMLAKLMDPDPPVVGPGVDQEVAA